MSAITANAMFAAHQAELVATATSLVGRPVTLHIDPTCKTAYTDGHRVVTKPMHPLVEAGSPEWHEARALLLHEMMHLQDSPKNPHMHDFRMMISKKWKMTPTMRYVHNLCLDYSIESGQDYTLYKGVLHSITVLHNTLLRSDKALRSLLSREQPDWLRALYVLDDTARRTWMSELRETNHEALLAVGHSRELYERIAPLLDDYLRPKGEDPDKDYRLAQRLVELLEAEPKRSGDDDPRRPPRKGGGEEGESGDSEPEEDNDDDNDEGSDDEDNNRKDEDDPKGEEDNETNDEPDKGDERKEKESEEGEDNEHESDEGEKDGEEADAPCEADKVFLKDDHSESFKSEDEFTESERKPRDRGPRKADIHSFVLDPAPRIVKASNILKSGG